MGCLKKKRKQINQTQLESTADSHLPFVDRQEKRLKRVLVTMPKNMFGDTMWPGWKDILLMEEMKAARKKEDIYSNYKWKEEELWELIQGKVNSRINSATSGYESEVSKEDIKKRARQYVKEYSRPCMDYRAKFRAQIKDYTLKHLVDDVFLPKFDDLGPPKIPRSKCGSSSVTTVVYPHAQTTSSYALVTSSTSGNRNSGHLFDASDAFATALEEIKDFVTNEEWMWAMSNIPRYEFHIKNFIRLAVEARVNFVKYCAPNGKL